jgi:cytochrome c oxidase subunit 1
MPRRYHTYDGMYSAYHMTSTIGSLVLTLGFFIAIYALIKSARSGEKAPMNPWGGTTLEWTVPSPPPHENFDTVPTVTGRPYEYR